MFILWQTKFPGGKILSLRELLARVVLSCQHDSAAWNWKLIGYSIVIRETPPNPALL